MEKLLNMNMKIRDYIYYVNDKKVDRETYFKTKDKSIKSKKVTWRNEKVIESISGEVLTLNLDNVLDYTIKQSKTDLNNIYSKLISIRDKWLSNKEITEEEREEGIKFIEEYIFLLEMNILLWEDKQYSQDIKITRHNKQDIDIQELNESKERELFNLYKLRKILTPELYLDELDAIDKKYDKLGLEDLVSI